MLDFILSQTKDAIIIAVQEQVSPHPEMVFSEYRRLAYLPNLIVMCYETNALGVLKK